MSLTGAQRTVHHSDSIGRDSVSTGEMDRWATVGFGAIYAELILGVVIAYALWTKDFSVPVYVSLVAAFCVAVGVAVWIFRRSEVFTLLHLIVAGGFALSIYYIATHFAVLPWGDTYGQYWVLAEGVAQGKFVLDPGPGAGAPDFYTAWPGMHLVAAAIVNITGLSPFVLALVFPWVMFVALMLFGYLLIKSLIGAANRGSMVLWIALVVLIASPFSSLEIPPIYKYQGMGTVLFLILAYCLFQYAKRDRDLRFGLVAVLAGAAIVVTHHYTTTMLLLFMLTLLVATQAHRFIPGGRAGSLTGGNGGRYGNFLWGATASIAVVTIVWWTFTQDWVWNSFENKIAEIQEYLPGGEAAHTVSGGDVVSTVSGSEAAPIAPGGEVVPPVPGSETTPSFWTSGYPAPSPASLVGFLWARDGLMIGSAAAGMAFLVFSRASRLAPNARGFVLAALVIVGIFSLGDVTLHLTGRSFRSVTIFLPFIGLAVALGLTTVAKLLKIPKSMGAVGAIAVIAVFLSAAMIGMIAHRFVPSHLYSNSVTWQEAGEHPKDWKRLSLFMNPKVDFDRVDQIVTDQTYVLSLGLPLDQWRKVRLIGVPDSKSSSAKLVIGYQNLNPLSYHAQSTGRKWVARQFAVPGSESAAKEVRAAVPLVYDDGNYQIWSGN